MSDLISRSALIEKMNDTNIEIMFDLPVEELLGEDVDMDDFCTLLQDAIQAYRKLVIGEVMKKAPTVEAKPVVHGEWMGCDMQVSICSNCREVFGIPINRNHWNFCPNCGADMRGGKNGTL